MVRSEPQLSLNIVPDTSSTVSFPGASAAVSLSKMTRSPCESARPAAAAVSASREANMVHRVTDL